MTPDYRAALYTLIENAVSASIAGEALFGAVTPRTSRAEVTETKTVKVVSGPGIFNFGAEASNRARNCLFTIQCWVTPESDSEAHLEDALDLAVTMAEDIHKAIHNNQNLGGAVCLADADEYDAEFASLGATTRAAAYLDGTINPGDVSG